MVATGLLCSIRFDTAGERDPAAAGAASLPQRGPRVFERGLAVASPNAACGSCNVGEGLCSLFLS